jgi:hypothetical protein
MAQRTQRIFEALFATLLAVVVVGCKSPDEDLPAPVATKAPVVPDFTATAAAGTRVDRLGQPVIVQQINTKKFPARNDPFQLHPIEQSYEVKQENMRVFASTGQFFPALVEDQPEVITVPVVQPQPYRRLAGVMVGETVVAIIDMGDGGPMRIIRPGERVEGTEWTVYSIDSEKAVLRRTGQALPREIIVRLESPPLFRPTGGSGGAPGGGGGQGNQGGGNQDDPDPSRTTADP